MPETPQGSDHTTKIAAPETANKIADTPPSSSSGLTGFSTDGAIEYQKISQEYLIALEQASRAVAMQRKSDSVSPFHVQLAAGSLGKDSDGKFKYLSELGALLIGAGLGYLGIVVYGGSFTFKNALIVFIPLLLGCILYAYSWGR